MILGQIEERENTLADIREFFLRDAAQLKPDEFKEFWTSLTDQEKLEYKRADLRKP